MKALKKVNQINSRHCDQIKIIFSKAWYNEININQFETESFYSTLTNNNIDFEMNLSDDYNNYWLAGFSDADASFQIKIINRLNKRLEVRLNYQIDQKDQNILIQIKNFITILLLKNIL